MTPPRGLPPSRLTKIPPDFANLVLARGEWSYCAMEHSRIGAIALEDPGAPFHHIALPLDRTPLRFMLKMDGLRLHGRNAPDTVAMIEAGAAGVSQWDGVFESACLYFTDDALSHVLGLAERGGRPKIRTGIDQDAPVLARLLHALHLDAIDGQPHGALVGDAVFLVLAAHLATHRIALRARPRNGEPWRVGNALAFIHSHLTEDLTIDQIAEAAATSPYYLNHAFRAAMGCSIWRYVLRERARHALVLMRREPLTLTEIALAAGFNTYPSFIAAARREFGQTPRNLRRRILGR